MADSIASLRMVFLGMASSVYLVNSFEGLRKRFVAYGPRTVERQDQPRSSLVDVLAALSVPHSWFTHFYAASVLCSLFWLAQVVLVWGMMLAQGCRRLYECVLLQKPSSSRMWAGHWLLGVGFYVLMSIAVWIEGAHVVQRGLLWSSLRLTAPTLKTLLGLPFFLLASGAQHDCHGYLASLKKYSLPQHPAFSRLIAPHYLAECVIYASLALVAAPAGQVFNPTILTALSFVAVNLGLTSINTRQWYAQKFGPESIALRWNMLPFVF